MSKFIGPKGRTDHRWHEANRMVKRARFNRGSRNHLLTLVHRGETGERWPHFFEAVYMQWSLWL